MKFSCTFSPESPASHTIRMPKLDRYSFSSASFSSESSVSWAQSAWCCRAARKTRNIPPRASFEAQDTYPHDKDQPDSMTPPDHRGCVIDPGTEKHCTATSPSSMESIFLRLQRWPACFQGGGGPYSTVSAENPLGARKLADTSPKNETKRKDKKKIEVTDLMNDAAAFPTQIASAAAQQMPTVLYFKAEKPGKDSKFNWVDKYRPKYLNEFICHREEALKLRLLVSKGLSNHCIFEGPPGVGKKTMALALLRENFGTNGIDTREEIKEFKVEVGPVSSIQVSVEVSSKHIEVDLSELKSYAALVVVELIKETRTLLNHDNTNHQAIILYGTGILSMDDQLQIKSCLETYKDHYKVYFCSSGAFKLQHIESLFTVIRIPPPSKEQIINVLEFIAKREDIELPPRLAAKIAEESKHSIQQATRSFEATRKFNYPFKEDQMILTGWEEELAILAKNIVDKQGPKQLYILREKLKIFMAHNVSPEIISKSFAEEMDKLLTLQFQMMTVKSLWQDFGLFDRNLGSIETEFIMGRRIEEQGKWNAVLFLRIEESIVKCMSIYKIISQRRGLEKVHSEGNLKV